MTSTTTPTRYVDGVALPAAGRWEIDPGHAEVAFIGRHFMITKVRGRFTDVRGSVTVAENFADSTVDVVIGMASVESGNRDRDEHISRPSCSTSSSTRKRRTAAGARSGRATGASYSAT